MQVNSKSLIDRYGDKLKCKQGGWRRRIVVRGRVFRYPERGRARELIDLASFYTAFLKIL